MNRLKVVIAAVLLVSLAASARGPDGALGAIREPNGGMPVAIQPADSFEVLLRREAQLALVRGQSTVPLKVDWTSTDSGRVRGRCKTGPDLAPGLYGLEAQWDGGTDRVGRAVYVARTYAANYLFVSIGEMGLDGQDQGEAAIRLKKTIKALNASPAAFAVLTGNQTAHGAAMEYQQLLALLASCKKPTYLCAGPADGVRFDTYFSRSDYSFTWGQDGFLACDTRDSLPAWDLDGQAGRLQRWRWAIKPQRWSIGFSYQYAERMGMRSQLALFIDDPLDYFLVSRIAGEKEQQSGHVMWGTTPLIQAPSLTAGRLRLVQVKDEEVTFAEPAAPGTSH